MYKCPLYLSKIYKFPLFPFSLFFSLNYFFCFPSILTMMHLCIMLYMYRMPLQSMNTIMARLSERLTYSFIHSDHFYSTPLSPLPLRGAPDYSMDTLSEFHAEVHRQLQVKDLPKVPT